jgi:hypothetical protein
VVALSFPFVTRVRPTTDIHTYSCTHLTQTHPLTLTYTHTHTLSLSHSHSGDSTARDLFLRLLWSLCSTCTHAYTNTPTHADIHTHTLSLSLTLATARHVTCFSACSGVCVQRALTLTQTHPLTLTYTHTLSLPHSGDSTARDLFPRLLWSLCSTRALQGPCRPTHVTPGPSPRTWSRFCGCRWRRTTAALASSLRRMATRSI